MTDKQAVYVLVAMDDYGRVRECFVRTHADEAFRLRESLSSLYGGANVCLASRFVDDTIPSRIIRHTIDTQLEGIVQGLNIN